MIRLVPLLALAGCALSHVADAPPEPPALVDAGLDDDAVAELAYSGAQGITRVVHIAEAEVAAWDEATRQQARASADALIGNCPFHRSAVQIPIALAVAAARHDADKVDVQVRAEWRQIQAGLAAHVALLDQLGVGDLRPPHPSEHLADHADLLTTREALEAAVDPIALTARLVDQVPALVEAFDPDVALFVTNQADALAAPTHGRWPYLLLIDAWRVDLESIAPAIQDPELAADVAVMIHLLEAYGGMGC